MTRVQLGAGRGTAEETLFYSLSQKEKHSTI